MARGPTTGSDYLLHSTSAPVTTAPLTMAMWVKRTADFTSNRWFLSVKQGGAASSRHVWLLGGEVTTNKAQVRVGNASTSASAVSTAAMPLDEWCHVAARFNSGDTVRAAFLNGTKGTDSSTAARIPLSVDNVSVGCEYGTSAGGNGGAELAEAAIWDVALSNVEIILLSRGLSPLLVRPSNLVFYAPLLGDGNEIDVARGRTLTETGTLPPVAHPRIIRPFAQILQFPSAAAAGDTLTATGVATGEGYGTPTLSATATISATGVATAEAYGTPTLANVTLMVVNGVDTAEAYGTPTFASFEELVATGLATQEGYGSPTLNTGQAILDATGVATAEAYGEPTISSVEELVVTGLASGEAYGSATLAWDVVLTATGVESAEAYGAPTIAEPGVVTYTYSHKLTIGIGI